MSPKQGTSDIFFPTDFTQLQKMYEAIRLSLSDTRSMPQSDGTHRLEGGCRGEAIVCMSRDFLESFADTKSTTTRSGYNPLLEDYANTSILTLRFKDGGMKR